MIKVKTDKMIYEIGEKVYAIDTKSVRGIDICTTCNGSSELKVEGKNLYVKCPICKGGVITDFKISSTVVELVIVQVKFMIYYDFGGESDGVEYCIDSDLYHPQSFYYHGIQEGLLFKTKEDAYAVMNNPVLLEEYKDLYYR